MRLERQAIFAREAGSPMYWVVIHEGVLRHVVGSLEIMQAQLGRLIDAADSPDILIQVLPYSASDHPGCSATRWLGTSASRWVGMTGDRKGPADGIGGAWWCSGCRGGVRVVVVSRWRG